MLTSVTGKCLRSSKKSVYSDYCRQTQTNSTNSDSNGLLCQNGTSLLNKSQNMCSLKALRWISAGKITSTTPIQHRPVPTGSGP